MEQMIYNLKLPQLPECIIDGVVSKYLYENNKTNYAASKPIDFFKSEFLNLKGLNWTEVLIFLRNNGRPGVAHTDNADPNNVTTWGINWIYGGYGIMEYWDLNNFKKGDIKYVVDKHGYSTLHAIPSMPADLKYILKPGAYLVNTSMIHRATGFQKRYCVSYRATGKSFSWGEVINVFDDLTDKDAFLSFKNVIKFQ